MVSLERLSPERRENCGAEIRRQDESLLNGDPSVLPLRDIKVNTSLRSTDEQFPEGSYLMTF